MGCPVLVGSTQGLLSSVGRQVAPDGTFRDTEDFDYVCLAIAELGHHPNGVRPALVRVVFLTWVPALGVARGLAFAELLVAVVPQRVFGAGLGDALALRVREGILGILGEVEPAYVVQPLASVAFRGDDVGPLGLMGQLHAVAEKIAVASDAGGADWLGKLGRQPLAQLGESVRVAPDPVDGASGRRVQRVLGHDAVEAWVGAEEAG